MKIRIQKSIKDGKYCVNVITEDFSQDKEVQGMIKYGEPEVNVGGTYGDNGAVDPDPLISYTMPDNIELLKTSFNEKTSGFTMVFDTRDYNDAEKRADEWADTIASRIEVAILALRAKMDSFTEEKVYNI